MHQLDPSELRVLGVLVEKERTTPDQYPLSLNAVMLGCNQKSNRDPVLNLSEGQVQRTLDGLGRKGLVLEDTFSSRVAKYKQRFGNTEFSSVKLDEKEQAIIAVLFLRGPQTPGELRTRCARLSDFESVEEVEQVLNCLAEREGGSFVRKLPRQPGRRESRYQQLFSGDTPVDESESHVGISDDSDENVDTDVVENCPNCGKKMLELESKLEKLNAEVQQLKAQWKALSD
ncbi:MAG: hypothetical protein ACI93R_001680 [Flavobacteriales bacterium]|jgi:uncharacterized protein YceH (UPF0502 family)